jgi:hypothetical protein
MEIGYAELKVSVKRSVSLNINYHKLIINYHELFFCFIRLISFN